MPTLIHCPSCQQTVRVPDNLMHQHVRCPACENTFTATPEMAIQEPPRAEPETAPSAAGEYAAPPEPLRPTPVQPTATRPPLAVQPHRGVAILILGIMSIVLPCGFGFILGIIAWVMGNTDLRAMREGRMDLTGESMTAAGRVCGIIGTCINALGICCCGPGILIKPGFRPHQFNF